MEFLGHSKPTSSGVHSQTLSGVQGLGFRVIGFMGLGFGV